mgnify:CR=1 FL=1
MFEDSQIIYGAALNLQNFCESSADKKFNKEIFSVKFKISPFDFIPSTELVANKLQAAAADANSLAISPQPIRPNFTVFMIYYPFVYKGFAYSTAFTSVKDYYLLNFIEKFLNHFFNLGSRSLEALAVRANSYLKSNNLIV